MKSTKQLEAEQSAEEDDEAGLSDATDDSDAAGASRAKRKAGRGRGRSGRSGRGRGTPAEKRAKGAASAKRAPGSPAKRGRRKRQAPQLQVRASAAPAAQLSSEVSRARAKLHLAALPSSTEALPCREVEFYSIHEFVREKVQAGASGCMFVSGVPGTGWFSIQASGWRRDGDGARAQGLCPRIETCATRRKSAQHGHRLAPFPCQAKPQQYAPCPASSSASSTRGSSLGSRFVCSQGQAPRCAALCRVPRVPMEPTPDVACPVRPPQFVEINAMALTSPRQAYVELWRALSPDPVRCCRHGAGGRPAPQCASQAHLFLS